MYRQYEVLYKAFNLFNEHYFDNELPPCMITLQKKRENKLGDFTVEPIWFNENQDEFYQININPINMNREPEEILSTLLHEVIHYYCTLHKIKDCKQKMHTTAYKEVAESHGLNVEYDDDIGWSITSLNDESVELVKDLIVECENDFVYMYIEKKPVKKTQFKYVCESCGLKVYAKAEKSIVCGECGCELMMEQVEEDNENESEDN